MARIVIVRHAQSTWNAAGRWQGWADPPLSAAGRQQVERAAPTVVERLRPGLVVSSDLQRAVHTARILAPGHHVAVDSAWREHGVGAWSGLTRDEIEQRWPGALGRWARGELGAPPGGEPRADFDARLMRAVERWAGTAGAATVLVVSHGGAIRSVARQVGQHLDGVGNLAGIDLAGTGQVPAPQGVVDLLEWSAGDAVSPEEDRRVG